MQFDIDPIDGRADGPVVIRLVDIAPGARVAIEAATTDGDGRQWSSTNDFVADDAGTIDLARDAPVSGSYFTMNPLGVVTTMTPEHDTTTSVFTTRDAAPMVVELLARGHRGEMADASITRYFQGPDVERSAVGARAVYGTLFSPIGRSDRPAVLVVPGTIPAEVAALPMAALLADQGYVVLVLDLTGHSGLPDHLYEVPLEGIADALDWLRTQPEVDSGRVGAIGIERGAEALLGAASHLPQLALSGIVAVAPSCVAWQADDSDEASAWSVGGTPLPCGIAREGLAAQLFPTLTGQEEGASVAAHRDALENIDLLRHAGFPVERIAAPLLLLAGGDDKQWPSSDMADLIVRARRAKGEGPADRVVTYPGAGRLVRAPYLPATADRYVDPEGRSLLLGGRPDDNRRADVAGWGEITDFLSRVLDADVVATVPVGGRPVDPEWPAVEEPDPGPDPEDLLARSIVKGVDLDLDRGAAISNPLPPPPADG